MAYDLKNTQVLIARSLCLLVGCRWSLPGGEEETSLGGEESDKESGDGAGTEPSLPSLYVHHYCFPDTQVKA